jgi:hypothetical protein
MHFSSRPTTAIHWLHNIYLQLLAIRDPEPVDGTILPITEVPPTKFFRRRSNYGMPSNLVLSNPVWVCSEVDCEAVEADVGAEPLQVRLTLHVDNLLWDSPCAVSADYHTRRKWAHRALSQGESAYGLWARNRHVGRPLRRGFHPRSCVVPPSFIDCSLSARCMQSNLFNLLIHAQDIRPPALAARYPARCRE